MFTRRRASLILIATPFGLVPAAAAEEWTEEWDRAVLRGALAADDEAYDPAERMLTRKIGAQYQYHTNLRSMTAHPTRESLEYALYLLEDGSDERQRRALEVLDRVLPLQDTAETSQWYGLWGWYLEEPPSKMSPADWNWADFNGATLLFIERRHGSRLSPQLHQRIRNAIRHAAYSIRRRNVGMGYTNIAIMGTFVTLAAAELLGYTDLTDYAKQRMRRLAEHINQTGSFDEYNSPTYTQVAIANLTRMRMMIRGMEMRQIAERIHERAWLHFASHWHYSTRQLAGPMSRCYFTDIGSPLWLQKALSGELAFATIEEARASGEVAVLDFNCPEELRHFFLEPGEPRQHREIFQGAEPPETPLQGTTWLIPDLCLGSANQADFWVQRRPLLGYWGGPERPMRYLRLRLLKDDYDFSSGLFHSVQEKGSVLGLINFRWPGGDRHPGLEPIENGAFECSRLRVRADLAVIPDHVRLLLDGKESSLPATDLLPGSRVAIDLNGAYLWMRFPRAAFGDSKPRLSIEPGDGLLTVSLDLHRSASPKTIRWDEVRTAWAALNLVLESAAGTLEDFSLRCSMGHLEPRESGGKIRLIWRSPEGRLWLEGLTGIAVIEEHSRAYRAGIRSGPVPYIRLSDKRI